MIGLWRLSPPNLRVHVNADSHAGPSLRRCLQVLIRGSMSSLYLYVLTPYFAASESAAPAKARCADLGFVSQFRPYRDFKGGGGPRWGSCSLCFFGIFRASWAGHSVQICSIFFPPMRRNANKIKRSPGGKTYYLPSWFMDEPTYNGAFYLGV